MTRMCTDEEEEDQNFQSFVFSVKSVVQSCIGRVLSV
jgi:hypothetical protein